MYLIETVLTGISFQRVPKSKDNVSFLFIIQYIIIKINLNKLQKQSFLFIIQYIIIKINLNKLQKQRKGPYLSQIIVEELNP